MKAALSVDAEESSCAEAVHARLQLNAKIRVVGLSILSRVVIIDANETALLIVKPQDGICERRIGAPECLCAFAEVRFYGEHNRLGDDDEEVHCMVDGPSVRTVLGARNTRPCSYKDQTHCKSKGEEAHLYPLGYLVGTSRQVPPR